MKDNPLFKLITIRKSTNSMLDKAKEPKFDRRDEELESLRERNLILQNKIKTNEDLLLKNMNAMRYEIEIRDKEIFKLKQEISTKENEKNLYLKEINNTQQGLNQVISEKNEILSYHAKEIADLRLKHDQEIYILKKIKKN